MCVLNHCWAGIRSGEVLHRGAPATSQLVRRVRAAGLDHVHHLREDDSVRISRRILLSTAAVLPAVSDLVAATAANAQVPSGVLPSWNNGPAKQAIIEFVQATTTNGPNFVPLGERVAEFDQDGTLSVEHPVYTQIVYCLDHVGALTREKPELKGPQTLQDRSFWRPQGHREALDEGLLRDCARNPERHDRGGVQGRCE
jgi:hypothetical protein